VKAYKQTAFNCDKETEDDPASGYFQAHYEPNNTTMDGRIEVRARN
jgi:hypothetical protein